MLIVVLFQKYSTREVLLFLIIGIMCSIVSYQNRTIDPIITFGAVLSLKDIPFKKIIEVDFVTRLLSTGTIVILSILNIIPSNNFYSGNKADFLRHSFGFFHPNTFGAYIMILVLEFIYLGERYHKRNYRILILPVAVVSLELLSNNRTAELSMILYITVYSIFSLPALKRVKEKTYKLISFLILTVASMISLFVSYSFNNGSYIWLKINDLMSGRPKMINSIVTGIYPIHLFGQKTPLIGNTEGINIDGYLMTVFVDNSYMGILIKYGIVFFVLFLFWMLINSFKYLSGNKRVVMLSWLIAIVSWGISEDKLLAIQFNSLLLIYVSDSGGLKLEENLVNDYQYKDENNATLNNNSNV